MREECYLAVLAIAAQCCRILSAIINLLFFSAFLSCKLSTAMSAKSDHLKYQNFFPAIFSLKQIPGVNFIIKHQLPLRHQKADIFF